jgi:hypothetical protein
MFLLNVGIAVGVTCEIKAFFTFPSLALILLARVLPQRYACVGDCLIICNNYCQH